MPPKLILNVIYRAEEKNTYCLCQTYDLSGFGYFTRQTIREHLKFATRMCVSHTPPGTRQSVGLKDNPFFCHTWVRADGLAGVLVAEKNYPLRIAFALIQKTLTDYESKVGAKWKEVDKDLDQEPAFMATDLASYQDPSEADKIAKIQKNLDEVKEVMQRNIEEILKRGETLESLMDRSKDLSAVSIQFYRKAKSTNQCCSYY